jgi:5-methylcytosine-specific restriction enzyme B
MYKDHYECWNEFLRVWPLKRVKNITIDEYTNLNDNETFTYWLEHRTKLCGGIRGGSSFKFGIFRKSNTDTPHRNSIYHNDDLYAWHSKYGETAKEAFSTIRSMLISLIEGIQKGNVSNIENIDLPEMLKRKVAFLYQSQTNPLLINVYDQKAIDNYFVEKISLSEMKIRLGEKLNGESIFSIAEDVWDKWKEIKDLRIWKISHGRNDISVEHSDWLNQHHYISLHKNTAKSQNLKFISELKIGDVAFVTRSSDVLGLISVSSDIVNDQASPLGEGWMLRKYEIITWLEYPEKFTSDESKKGWFPNYNSTFMRVAPEDFNYFETQLLQPIFDMSVDDLLIDVVTLFRTQKLKFNS